MNSKNKSSEKRDFTTAKLIIATKHYMMILVLYENNVEKHIK